MKKIIKLDIGCGSSKKNGFIGVDQLKLEGVDIVHDLNVIPYPFQDNYADEIILDNVLEHLNNPIDVIHELHRIAKPLCQITIKVPYFRSFYAVIDPTHKHLFSYSYFFYFDKKHIYNQQYRYFNIFFNIKSIKFDTCYKKENMRFFHRFIRKIANTYPTKYESKLGHIFPLNEIEYILEVDK